MPMMTIFPIPSLPFFSEVIIIGQSSFKKEIESPAFPDRFFIISLTYSRLFLRNKSLDSASNIYEN